MLMAAASPWKEASVVEGVILYQSIQCSSSIAGVMPESPCVRIIRVNNLQGARGGMNRG
jgi:hypothetical protein